MEGVFLKTSNNRLVNVLESFNRLTVKWNGKDAIQLVG
ncbi:hypothetical protein M2263_002402 [Providencia alcalifaciens]|nr:hypothetical protein [Providencia alcalifaciens]